MSKTEQMLRDALQALLDVQNGPPLHKTKDEWESAMKAGYEALAAAPAPAVVVNEQMLQALLKASALINGCNTKVNPVRKIVSEAIAAAEAAKGA